jgi:hypothetical protein
MIDELRQMVAITSADRLWIGQREFAAFHGLSPETIRRRERMGDIPAIYKRGHRKGLRYWRFYDPFNHRCLLGIEPATEGK